MSIVEYLSISKERAIWIFYNTFNVQDIEWLIGIALVEQICAGVSTENLNMEKYER